jgi:hypothetical protein
MSKKKNQRWRARPGMFLDWSREERRLMAATIQRREIRRRPIHGFLFNFGYTGYVLDPILDSWMGTVVCA